MMIELIVLVIGLHIENPKWDASVLEDRILHVNLGKAVGMGIPRKESSRALGPKSEAQIRFEKLVHDARWENNPLAPIPGVQRRNEDSCSWRLRINGVPEETIRAVCGDGVANAKMPSVDEVVHYLNARVVEFLQPGEITWQPDRNVLVNKDVYFSATARALEKTVSVLGVSVRLHAQPIAYTWNLGDGRQFSTRTPGGAWPRGDAHWPYMKIGNYMPSVKIEWLVDVSVGEEVRRLNAHAYTLAQGKTLRVTEAEAILTRGDETR
ncbi:PKD domain-containing protein [Arcanobacterium canis]